ncbi:MAG: hypothetical protein RMK43_00565 [Cyclobacteriaceae bacterium]|nr:hypothetical protein [Cyclobacteriaceae bacterium]
MRRLFIPFVMLALSSFANSTPAGQKSLLAEQYRQMLEGVEVIEGYRMVRVMDVEKLWKAVNDSLRAGEELREKMKQEIAGLQASVTSLKKQVDEAQATAEELRTAVESFTVFGISWKKSSYRFISLLLTGLLLAIIVGLIITGRMNMRAAQDARKMYEDLYHEFDRYRHSAVERQIKLSRELQDYRNRQTELKSA